MADEEFESRVGTWLRGKWKLERLIAIGGMAGVYEANHKIGRKAAIKVLRSEIAADKTIRERFEQEAAAVNSVGHHAVVQVLDVDEDDDGTPFLVMELLEGETLADRVEREKKLKTEQLLDIVDQLLDVLIACHKKGIIHRDIKPENLFLQSNGRLKVLDFGIARVREGVRTVAGTMLGTVAFMPPEQLKGHPIDARADLFAVGATMFAVVSGRRLHLAKDDTELAMKMLTEPSPRLKTVVDAPEPVCLVVDRALAYLPKRRYPDAQTMRGDVWAARRGERPPYAHACERAGQDPDVLNEADAEQKKPTPTRPDRGAGPLPTTDPQMPVFVTDMPAPGDLPSTDPQMPAFAEPSSESEVASQPAEASSNDDDARAKPSERPAPETPSHTDERWPPDDEADDEADDEPDERPADDVSEETSPEDDGADEDDDAAPDSDEPASEEPASLPPQGDAPAVDAGEVARRQNKSYGFVYLIVLLLAAGGYAAWYAGLFDAPKTPKAAPAHSAG